MMDECVEYMGWGISAQEQIEGFRNEVRELKELIANVHKALCLDEDGLFRDAIIKSLERDMLKLGVEV